MYKIEKIIMTCPGYPSQWEGYAVDYHPVYVRYRWGYLSVRIGPQRSKDFMSTVCGDEIFGVAIDDSGWDGVMNYKNLVEVTSSVIEWPEKESTENVWSGYGEMQGII